MGASRQIRFIFVLGVSLAIANVSGEAQAAQAGAPQEAELISLLAKASSQKNNAIRNGEGSSRVAVLVGGADAFASSTTDGTGNGDTTGFSGSDNGNNNTGNGNGNGNGNNNAQIIIQNDPTFLTCPPCQYYDPSQQLCISVQSCLANKPSTTTGGAATQAAATSQGGASQAATASGAVTSAGRRLLGSSGTASRSSAEDSLLDVKGLQWSRQ